MAVKFTSKRISDYQKVLPGSGSLMIAVPFVPNYVRAEFSDVAHSETNSTDTVTWDLTLSAPGQYSLSLSYTAATTRMLHYVVAKLPVDPEETISF